jgi:hypothetical protein
MSSHVRPYRLLPTLTIALVLSLAGLGLAHTSSASAQMIDVNGTQPITTSYVPGSGVVAVNAFVPTESSFVAPPVVSSYVAPVAPTFVTTVVAPAPDYVSSGGSYCQLPGGGQVFVNAGSSPAVYGC